MRTKTMASLLSIVLVLGVMPLPAFAAGGDALKSAGAIGPIRPMEADVTAPVINVDSLSIAITDGSGNPKQAGEATTVGDAVSFSATVTDDVGIERVIILLNSPQAGKSAAVSLARVGDTDEWAGSLEVDDQVAAGTWRASYAYAEDTSGNATYLYNWRTDYDSDPGFDGYADLSALDFEVEGTHADVAPPAIDAGSMTITLPEGKAAAGPGDAVSFSATVTDDVGIERVIILLNSPQAGKSAAVSLARVGDTDEWAGSLEVDDQVAAGTWRASYAYAEDTSGNATYLYNWRTDYDSDPGFDGYADLSALDFEVYMPEYTDNLSDEGYSLMFSGPGFDPTGATESWAGTCYVDDAASTADPGVKVRFDDDQGYTTLLPSKYTLAYEKKTGDDDWTAVEAESLGVNAPENTATYHVKATGNASAGFTGETAWFEFTVAVKPQAYARFDTGTSTLTLFKSSRTYANGQAETYTDDSGEQTVTYYTGLETEAWTSDGMVPWSDANHTMQKAVTKVVIEDALTPVSMERWFAYMQNLETIEGLDKVDTSNVTSMRSVFYGCRELGEIDVSRFNTSNVVNFYQMFYGCAKVSELDVSHFETSRATLMTSMFLNCSALSTLNISGFDTANVTSMEGMFAGCTNLATLDVSGFDTANVTTMKSMFSGCGALSAIDVSGFDTKNVTTMQSMFSSCKTLSAIDVSGFDTGNLEWMAWMFAGCEALRSADISGFDTGGVIAMSYLFQGCENLEAVVMPASDNPVCTGMYDMFKGCPKLTELDLSAFHTASAEKMSGMFDGCSSLKRLDISNFDTAKINRGMEDMFNGCAALAEVKLGGKSVFDDTALGDNPPAGEWQLLSVSDTPVRVGQLNDYNGGAPGWYAQGYRDLSIMGVVGKTYTGKTATQAPVVRLGEVTLRAGVDYELTYANAVNAAKATDKAAPTVTVTGAGDYTGSASRTFTILPKTITPKVTLAATSYTYSGKARKPAVTAKAGKVTLVKGTDYTVAYAKGRKSVGKYAVKVTCKGNYSGSKKAYFTINPKGTAMKGATATTGKLTVRWAKQATKMASAHIGGYQVQLATNAKFTSGKKTVTVKGFKNTSKKIGSLKTKAKYWTRIRTYMKVGGKTYYSPWSKALAAKTK